MMLSIFTSSDKRAVIFSLKLDTIRELLKCSDMREELEDWYKRVDPKLKGNMSLTQFIDNTVKHLILHEWFCSMANDNQLKKFKKKLSKADKDWLFDAKRELYLRLRNSICRNPVTKKVDHKLSMELMNLIQYLNI